MRILCGCVVSFSVLLSSFLGSAAWSQSGTSEPPGLDEIIAAANSYACFHYYRDRSAAKAAQAYCRYFTGVRPHCKAFPGAIQVCGSVQNVLRTVLVQSGQQGRRH